MTRIVKQLSKLPAKRSPVFNPSRKLNLKPNPKPNWRPRQNPSLTAVPSRRPNLNLSPNRCPQLSRSRNLKWKPSPSPNRLGQSLKPSWWWHSRKSHERHDDEPDPKDQKRWRSPIRRPHDESVGGLEHWTL